MQVKFEGTLESIKKEMALFLDTEYLLPEEKTEDFQNGCEIEHYGIGYTLILRVSMKLGGLTLEDYVNRFFQTPDHDVEDGTYYFKFCFEFFPGDNIPVSVKSLFGENRKFDAVDKSKMDKFNALFPDYETILCNAICHYRWQWQGTKTLRLDLDETDFEYILK